MTIGLDRCFCDKKDESIARIDPSYEGMCFSFNGRLLGKIERISFKNPPQREVVEIKPFPKLNRGVFLYRLYDLCLPKMEDVKDEDFEVGKTESFVDYRFTREEIDRNLLRRTEFVLAPAKRTIDELTNQVYDGPLPVKTWVKEEVQYFFSVDGRNWVSQFELFPDDYRGDPQ
jgi:hypothetical protein